MSKRKIALLTACGVLLCMYILQLVFANRNPVKTVTLATEPDTIEIKSDASDITLTKHDSSWLFGPQNYKAEETAVADMVEKIKNVTILDTVDRGDSAERYSLTPDKAITVTASNGGKVLRTLTVGKASSTGSQTYLTIDGGKNISLVSGNLHDTFAVSADSLRSKTVYTTQADSLTKITVTTGTSSLTVEKSGDPAVWSAAGGTAAVDAEKTAAWATSLGSLNAAGWLDDSFTLPVQSTATAVLTAGGKTITVTIYTDDTDKDKKYYGTCSETPYKFSVSPYSAALFMKNISDLKK